jgi:hypothetical protein
MLCILKTNNEYGNILHFGKKNLEKVVNNAVTCVENTQTGTNVRMWEMPLVRDPLVREHSASSLSR